jgi:hypothetical protein
MTGADNPDQPYVASKVFKKWDKEKKMRKQICLYTKAEKSVLLYMETCMVDGFGKIESRRMNQEDWEAIETIAKEGLITCERLPAKIIMKYQKISIGRLCTHIVTFTDLAWELVGKFRRERSDRMIEHGDAFGK